jgi:hypothetical protein
VEQELEEELVRGSALAWVRASEQAWVRASEEASCTLHRKDQS